MIEGLTYSQWIDLKETLEQRVKDLEREFDEATQDKTRKTVNDMLRFNEDLLAKLKRHPWAKQ